MSFVIRADNLLKYMSLSHVISTHTTENSLIPTTLHVTVLHMRVTYNHMATNRKQTKGNLAWTRCFPSER